tara:strand:+ start:335 stop:1276 length:942 start_codon:yes stop_codon:yes gene_type:complete
MIKKKLKIFLAGHNGMVGSSILRKLKLNNYINIHLVDKKKLNLLDQKKVYKYLKRIKPKIVIIAAARAGGIYANSTNKAKFIFENLQIQNNLIHGSYLAGVKNLIFLGSSCVYPKDMSKPINEDALLSGKLELTNDSYAISKIAGLTMCRDYSNNYKLNYKSLMPTNLYGPGDNYDSLNSHFFPALIKKIYNAKLKNKKKITLWGSGNPKRELMYVDDLADAVIYFMNKKFKEAYLNIGTGKDYSVKWYANFVSEKLNYKVFIDFDKSMPGGTKRKVLNTKLSQKYDWMPKISLNEGFKLTFKDFLRKKLYKS